jgi:hypothetical protein
MKTFTEFLGFELREAYAWREELIKAQRTAGRMPKTPEPKAPPPGPPSAESVAVEPATALVENASEVPAEAVAPEVALDAAPVAEVAAPAEDVPEVPVEAAASADPMPDAVPETPPMPVTTPVGAAETPPAVAAPTGKEEPHIKTPEERYEEFEKRKAEDEARHQREWQELLEAIREPLTARIKEKHKWPDERIAFAIRSLDLIDKDGLSYLRRIRVLKLDKPDERLPRDSRKIDEHVYVSEYLPRPEPPRQDRDERGGPRGRGRKPGRGDGKPGRGRPGGTGEKREWKPRGPGPQGARPQGARPQGPGSPGARPVGQRPQGPRPQGARPQGARPPGSRPQGQDRTLADGKREFRPPQRPQGPRSPKPPKPQGTGGSGSAPPKPST